jgi:hypothetical protein
MRRASSIITTLALLTAGCGFMPSLATPTPGTPSPSPSPSSDASVASLPPSDDEDPSEAPTPDLDAVPRFAVGSEIITSVGGLRVRSRPGTEQRVITTLGTDARLLVGLGPILVDGLGWYLVRDADDAEPVFGEGWVAAGFEPDPFLVSAGFASDDGPYLGGTADRAPSEFGPVTAPERGMTLRWIAAVHLRDVCSFALDLAGESGEPVRAVRTPVGGFPASGELPAEFFSANRQLRGPVFATVQSDCSWAISFVRVPRATPSPSPSPS